jgi:hypothetical protein
VTTINEIKGDLFSSTPSDALVHWYAPIGLGLLGYLFAKQILTLPSIIDGLILFVKHA